MSIRDVSLELPEIYYPARVEEIMERENISYEEAYRLYYQQTWKWERRQFSNDTRCIASFFARVLPKVKTADCRKIVIECVPKVTQGDILNFSGVYAIQREFDYDAFKCLPDYDKKVATFEMMKGSVLKVVERMKWDPQPFHEAFNHIVNADYKNVWVWRKKVFNPSKTVSAEVRCVHEVKDITIRIVFRDRSGNVISQVPVVVEIPNEWMYARHLGKLVWVSDTEVAG